MNKIAAGSAADRGNLFRETAARMGLRPVLVEKDFWVCWTLQQLFSIKALEGHIVFKGGTTLSKIYRAVKRFSEDIDLAVHFEMLGFTGERRPDLPRSGKQRKKLHEEMLDACRTYVENDFIRILRQRFTEVLGPEVGWRLAARENPNVHKSALVDFVYPPSLQAADALAYVKPEVLIEPGVRAAFTPRSTHRIAPFASEQFPHVFAEPDCEVVAIDAERTFWDKATILHAEYNRPAEKALPLRYSRHYFDLAVMTKTPIKEKALANMSLLEQAVKHKIEYFYNHWARYELAAPQTLHLVPAEGRLKELAQDYHDMKPMIFGAAPSFEEVVADLTSLETEIRRR